MNDIIANLGVVDEASLIIVILLPLTAGMLVSQTNPYHALVIRGIVGAIAALVYAFFGAADVALTEAFVGTMLSIMLYIVAVRSSMTMRVGCLKTLDKGQSSPDPSYTSLIQQCQAQLNPHYLRLEVFTYDTLQTLEEAMSTSEIHTMITQSDPIESASNRPFQVQTRLELLHRILNHPSIQAIAQLSLYEPVTSKQPHQGGA